MHHEHSTAVPGTQWPDDFDCGFKHAVEIVALHCGPGNVMLALQNEMEVYTPNPGQQECPHCGAVRKLAAEQVQAILRLIGHSEETAALAQPGWETGYAAALRAMDTMIRQIEVPLRRDQKLRAQGIKPRPLINQLRKDE